METMNELATRLKGLKDAKEQLAEATKKNNAEIEKTELELSNLMIEEGNDGFELNGYKFTLQYKDMFSTTVDKRPDLIEALKCTALTVKKSSPRLFPPRSSTALCGVFTSRTARNCRRNLTA